MFTSEARMLPPVVQWMESHGLKVKSEFVTPWGMCDLVGLSFKKSNVKERVRHGQRQPITSIKRAALLHYIPEHSTTTIECLASLCSPAMTNEVLAQETQRLVADKFVIQEEGGGFRRVNGWGPLHKRLMAIELKLGRIEEAMSQAWNNLNFAQESYVALPTEVALRVKAKRSRWASFFDNGVGVLAVNRQSCRILIRSRHHSCPDPILQFYCVEKFWGSHIKGNST